MRCVRAFEAPLRPPGLSAVTSRMRVSLSMRPAPLSAVVARVRVGVGLENISPTLSVRIRMKMSAW